MSAQPSHSVETNISETVPSSPIEYCSFPRPLKPLTLNKPVFQEKKVDWVKALEKVEAIHPIIREHLMELCLPKQDASSNEFDVSRFEAETSTMNLYLPQANNEYPPCDASGSAKRSRASDSSTSEEVDSEEENRIKELADKELCPPVSFKHFRKKMRMISRAKEDPIKASKLLSTPRHPNEVVFPYLDIMKASSTRGKFKGFKNHSSRRGEQKSSKSKSNI